MQILHTLESDYHWDFKRFPLKEGNIDFRDEIWIAQIVSFLYPPALPMAFWSLPCSMLAVRTQDGIWRISVARS